MIGMDLQDIEYRYSARYPLSGLICGLMFGGRISIHFEIRFILSGLSSYFFSGLATKREGGGKGLRP